MKEASCHAYSSDKAKRDCKRRPRKNCHFCATCQSNIFSDPDVATVYEIPLVLEEEGMRDVLAQELDIKVPNKIKKWTELVEAVKNAKKTVTIAICGKYTELADSYLSVQEALFHAGANNQAKVHIRWIETTDVEKGTPLTETLKGCDGVIIPGGFGGRGVEGKISIIRYLRENKIPFWAYVMGCNSQ